jgi:hypothetical protein
MERDSLKRGFLAFGRSVAVFKHANIKVGQQPQSGTSMDNDNSSAERPAPHKIVITASVAVFRLPAVVFCNDGIGRHAEAVKITDPYQVDALFMCQLLLAPVWRVA